MEKIKDVTIISTNLNERILEKYSDYHVVKNNYQLEDLLKYPKIIFYCLNKNLQEDFKYLKKNNILFINVTNDIENSLYTKNLIVYDKEKILIEGNTLAVLKKEKLLKRIGLQLPFYVELSILLKDYNLIDKIYLDKESLKSALWN